MSIKLKYYGYAGMMAECNGRKGIVCGWDSTEDDTSLIIAVTEGNGWKIPAKITSNMHIITHENNPKGYYFIEEKHIINF